jgi:hypothetical protein
VVGEIYYKNFEMLPLYFPSVLPQRTLNNTYAGGQQEDGKALQERNDFNLTLTSHGTSNMSAAEIAKTA